MKPVLKSIPVVDLTGLGLQPDEVQDDKEVERIGQELDAAFSTVGFVYVKNHGIDKQLIEKVFETSRSYFELSEETKNRQPWSKETFIGYTGKDREVFDSSTVHEIREAYDVTSPEAVYPDEETPEFRQSVNALAPKLAEVTRGMLKCLALAVGLAEDYFSSRHRFMFHGADKNGTILRSLYYPPLADADVQAGVVRCGEHSDYGTVTLLLQDDLGGLEVLSEKEWIAATPIAGTILVNLGDLMQFWTADRYRATVHRVRVPEEETRRRSIRQSIAFFVNPDNGVMIAPLDGSAKHPPVEALAYLKRRLSETYKF